jgi:hypothetical protein
MDETDNLEGLLGPRVRVLQIIAAALILGVLTFLIIAVVVVQQRGGAAEQPGAPPVLSYAALGFFAVALLLWTFVPALAAQGPVRKIAAGTWQPPQNVPATAYPSDAARLLAVYQTKTIIAGALLEGPAFLGGIAYLIEAQPITLGVPVAAVLLMLLTFPTRLRANLWLLRQQSLVDELRASGGLAGGG